MNKPKFDKWWKLKFYLLRIIPKKCSYCNGEIMEKGIKGHNRRIECRECNQTLIDWTL